MMGSTDVPQNGPLNGARSLYPMNGTIQHWARMARYDVSRAASARTQSAINARRRVGAGAPLVAIRVDDGDTGTKHTRGVQIRDRVTTDLQWAGDGLCREDVRQEELRAVLAEYRAQQDQVVPMAREAEAKRCGNEVRAFATQLDKLDDEIAIQLRQLRFAESDCSGLKISQERLAAQIDQGERLVIAEGPRVAHHKAEIQRLRAQLDDLRPSLASTEADVAATLRNAKIQESEYTRERHEHREDLAQAQGHVDMQAKCDALLPTELASLEAESTSVAETLRIATVERIHRQEKRKKLQERLKDTRALWNARQADLERALATHKDTAEVAQHDMQAMRFDSQTADTKLVWAMEQHTDAQNKLAPLKARCDELDQTLQAAQTRIDKNRRLSGVCENEMMRIMADYSRTEEALDASNELREELENRRLEVFTFQEQEALVLEARERTLTSDLAALKSRYEELSALIPSLAATEAEAATLDAKVKPGAAEQADDDKLAEEQSALASATNRLALVSKIRCDQEELALRASRQLESETAAWDAKRIDLLSKLAEVEAVVATHINFCKACESKRDAAAKKVANLDKTIKVVEIRHNSIVSNMAELKIKITQTREATALAKTTAASANCLRISTETECQVETDNFSVWQQIAIGETERLPGMTARILVKNVATAESHALWSTALTEVQRPYAMALSDVNNGQVKIDNYNQLIAKLSRLRDVAFTLDSRSKVPREGLVSGAPGGNNATAGELYGVHCAVDRFQRSVAEGNTSRIQ